jgi:AraC-like DNA-binding protein
MGPFDWHDRIPCPPAAAAVTRLHIEGLSCRGWWVGSGWSIPPRSLPDTFLFIPWSGQVVVRTEAGEASLAPGSALLVPEGLRHAVRFAAGCHRLGVFGVHVRCLADDASPADWRPLVHALPDVAAWCADLRRIAAWCAHDPGAGRDALAAVVRCLLGRWIFAGMELRVQTSHPRLGPALAALRADPCLGVTDLAAHARISAVRLRQLMARTTGLGPKAFIDRQRLSSAAQLLRSTGLPVAEVARRSGFSSMRRLQVRFLAAYGTTPSAWRNQVAP